MSAQRYLAMLTLEDGTEEEVNCASWQLPGGGMEFGDFRHHNGEACWLPPMASFTVIIEIDARSGRQSLVNYTPEAKTAATVNYYQSNGLTIVDDGETLDVVKRARWWRRPWGRPPRGRS